MSTTTTTPESTPVGAMRSPNFPAIPLPEAIRKVKVLYDADGKMAVSAKVLLEHLGYGERPSGASGRMVAALRQYGLVVAVGDKYRVSDEAFHILTLSDDSPIRKAAVVVLAKKPSVFREILNAFPERLPSDSALRDYLISEKKFNPASVETFIRALKGTFDYSKLYEGGYTGPDEPEPMNPTQPQPDPNAAPWLPSGSRTFAPTISGVTAPAGVSREVFSLEGGEAVLQWPVSIRKESVEELEDWLKLVIRKLKRRASAGDSEGAKT